MSKLWQSLNQRFMRWVWKRHGLVRIGAGESIPHEGKPSSIRVAPGRKGEPIASFWTFWAQGNEVYVAARSMAGMHKFSLHSNGKWYTTIDKTRAELAPRWPLPGGAWLHALEVRFLIGDEILPLLPEKPFKKSKPGHALAVAPGEFLTVQLLFGAADTTHETPLPEHWNWPKLLELTLRDGTCVVVIGANFPMATQQRRQLQALRALRFQLPTLPDPDRAPLLFFQIAVSTTNIVTVVPLGPESFTTEPAPPGARVRFQRVR